MKAKKTIAAIAALMLAVSSVSSLPFAVSANADDVPAAAENVNTETTDVPANDENADVSVPADDMAAEPLADTGVAVQSATETVLTAAEYAALTDEEKAQYAKVETNGMNMTYLKEETDPQGTTIPEGSYVKKGTKVWFFIHSENFSGDYVQLIYERTDDSKTDVVYLMNNIEDWGYEYEIGSTDIAVTAVSVGNNAPIVLSAAEYNNWIAGMKHYYTKVNVQAPAYVLTDPTGKNSIYIDNGDYVLKNQELWIALLGADYIGRDIYLNGEKLNIELQPDYGNAGIAYTVQTTDETLNVTVQNRELNDTDRNLRVIKVGNTINIVPGDFIHLGFVSVNNGEANYRYISYTIDQDYIVDISGEENMISFLVPRNLVYGSEILVNGEECFPTESTEDPAYWLYSFSIEDNGGDIVITQIESDRLDYFNDRFDFAEISIGSGISVREYPFGYDPNVSGDDQYAINFFINAYAASGTELLITVNASDYAGKVLKINGQTVNMGISGDGSCYVCGYTVNGTSPITMSLEAAALVVPSTPSTPSTPSAPSNDPVVTSPTAPSTPAPSESAAAAPSAKSVANDLKTSGKSSISYNATEAGVTKDILTAFAKNKSAKTMTAKFDNFKVKIKKSDIEDAKALEGIDFSVKEKDFISKSQIKKTNALKNSKKVVQLNFESNADVSGLKKVNIQAKAGKGFTDNTAVVYELKGNKLVKVGTAKVDLNGYVSFNTDHLGQFVVAVK